MSNIFKRSMSKLETNKNIILGTSTILGSGWLGIREYFRLNNEIDKLNMKMDNMNNSMNNIENKMNNIENNMREIRQYIFQTKITNENN